MTVAETNDERKKECAPIRREMRRENESDSKIPQSLSRAEEKYVW